MATIGQCAKEIKKLFEASMENGAVDGEDVIAPSRQAFITNLEQLCGLETHYTPHGKKFKKYNKEAATIKPDQMRELIPAYGMEALGHKWATQYEQKFDQVARTSRFESVGTPFMASGLPITCSLNDAYGIFLSAAVYEEEADEGYIADSLHEVVEPIMSGNGAIVNGGFEAGRRTAVSSLDVSGVDVGEGIIPPNMGMPLETMVHRNRARLNTRQYSWTRDSVMFNRISQDMGDAKQAARIVKYEQERKTVDPFLGIGGSLASSSAGNIGEVGLAMPVQIGGQEWYPYQNGTWVTPGTAPVSNTSGNAGSNLGGFASGRFEANYGNALDGNGAGITMSLLSQVLAQREINRDAFTNDVIPASLKGDTIYVANDVAEIQVLNLLYAWFIGIGPATGLTPLPSTTLYNFAKEQNLNIVKSQRAANRLVDVGLLTDKTTFGTLANQKLTFAPNDTYATAGSVVSFFVVGRPKEVIKSLVIQPFQEEDITIAGDDAMRGLAGLRKVSERSQVYYGRVPYQLSRAYA